MNGHLRKHPLVELIREISVAHLSGALRLRHERAQAAVFCHEGAVVLVSTNLRAHRLAESLRRWGVVAAETLDQAARANTTDAELGEALVKAGALARATLTELRARQALEALHPALLWMDGEWEFNLRVRLAEEARLQLPVAPLLLEAARRLPAEFVAARLANDEEIISPSPRAVESPELAGFALLPAEAFLLSRVEAPLRAGDLVALSGLPEEEARRTIYALALGGFLERTGWPRVFTEEALANARRVASTMRAGPAQSERKAAVTPAASAPPPRGEKEELEYLFARTSTANLYHRLGLTRRAKPEEVKRAYYTLAKRFHPDRFHKVDAETRARVESAFSQIMKAYETLQDSRTRAAYDLQLDAELAQQQSVASPSAANTDAVASSSSATNPPGAGAYDAPASSASATFSSPEQRRAEESFQRGMAALREQNQAAAAQHFAVAAQLAPREARYRAYHGHALAGETSARRQAEAELHAAIAFAPREPAYRLMLAELYLSIGLLRRAERELESALAVAPQHKEARRMLQELRTTENRG